MAYWEEVYKKTPIISPINGEVIVRVVEPGQTIMTSDAVLVLSDRLIVNAQFDETDIGKVKKGQKALVTLDAYPEITITGFVDHIAYESELVNNVTIYGVDIVPNEIPEILRSGMSVSIEVVEKTSEEAITIPTEAIKYEGKKPFVLIQDNEGKIVNREVGTGISSDTMTEIVSGLSINDKVVIEKEGFLLERKSRGSNPFMPSRKK
jgi:macrolide-specific efflux system membrane fusion protein